MTKPRRVHPCLLQKRPPGVVACLTGSCLCLNLGPFPQWAGKCVLVSVGKTETMASRIHGGKWVHQIHDGECLSYFPTTVKRHHNWDNYKRKHLIEGLLTVSEDGFHDHHDGKHGDKQGDIALEWWPRAYLSREPTRGVRVWGRNGLVWPMKPQSPAPGTHLLAQGHIS